MSDPDSTAPNLFKKVLSKISPWAKKQTKNLDDVLASAEADGLIDKEERDMLDAVLELDETLVREIMVPRTQLTICAAEETLDQALKLILKSGHSRIPVYLRDHDGIVGVLYAKDILRYWDKDTSRLCVADVMRRPHFVPESKKARDLLEELQSIRTHIALVVDEYGGLSGIITVEDVIEEIFGDIDDEFDKPTIGHEVISADHIITDALVELWVVEEHFDINIERDRCETVGGLLFELFGKMPKVGDVVIANGLRFEVKDIHKMRIGHVSIQNIEADKNEE